ncbi:MAG: flavodoxin domain-containing protein [Anaerorhabdus sp.]
MSKVAVVYYSGTGNTEMMANAIVEGVTTNGSDAKLINVSDFKVEMVSEFDAFAFGCPSMGDEALEESEFEPMWSEVSNLLEGKKVVLFGSYSWGDGQWMRDWESNAPCTILDTLICNETPDDEGLNKCRELSAKLL